MIFCKDSKTEWVETTKCVEPPSGTGGKYITHMNGKRGFKRVEYLSEDAIYKYYRQRHIQRNLLCRTFPEKYGHSERYEGPFDIYLVPKIFDSYIPFLDCDGLDSYNDVCALLINDGVPYQAYKSSGKDSYWIFCDRHLAFDDCLEFIKLYPADGRYWWVAQHRREFCVRALPKGYMIPKKMETSQQQFSTTFNAFISCFEDYWKNSKLVRYIINNKILENI